MKYEVSHLIIMDSVFVGREAEMQQLTRFLDQALASRGQVAFVTGEAGSGKTALVREFARHALAEQDAVVVALGEADAQTGVGDAYLPFREVLRVLAGDVDAQLADGAINHENVRRLRDFVGVSAQVLLDLGPDLLEFFVPGVALAARVGSFLAGQSKLIKSLEQHALRGTIAPTDSGNGIDQEHIFEQYTNVLTTLAVHQPLLLILDDLQWADEASISLLFRLGRRVTESRILLLGTYRPDDVALGRARGGDETRARHPLLSVVNEFKRYGGNIEVPLSDKTGTREDGEVEYQQRAFEFVSAYLDAAYAPNAITDEEIDLIARRTGGHPLFTIELLNALEERGWLSRTSDGGTERVWVCTHSLELHELPPRVEAVVTERTDRLTDEQRRILTVASVEGAEFTAQVIAEVEGLRDLELVRILEEELQNRHRLIEELGVRRHHGQMLFLYQFRHSIFQQFLYEKLGAAQRLMLHSAVGEALEKLYGDDTHDLEVTLAHHFLAAGDDAKALHYLTLAGDHAWSHHANHEAEAHYTRALEVTDRLEYEVEGELIEKLLMRRAQVRGWLGRVDEAVADYERALAAARAQHDAEGQVRCLTQMGALVAGPRGFKQGITHATEALQIALTAGDKTSIIDSLNCLGNFQANLGDLEDAAISHEQALELARELNDERRIANSLDGLRLARFDSTGEEQDLLFEIIELRRRLDDQKGLLNALTALASRKATLEGAYDAAEAMLDEALEISERIGERTTRPWILGVMAGLSWRSGRLGHAYEQAAQSLSLAQEINHEEWIAQAHITRGEVDLMLFRYEQALAEISKGVEMARRSGLFLLETSGRFLGGFAALEVGQPHETIEGLEPLVNELHAAGVFSWSWLGTAWLAQAYATTGAVDHALQLLEDVIHEPELRQFADVHAVVGYEYGKVLAAAGDLVAAENTLTDALALAESIGNPTYQVEIHLALGALHRDRNDSDAAAEHFTQILTLGQLLADSIADPTLRASYLAAPVFEAARDALSTVG